MTEQEEFEFRARLEAEAGNAAPQRQEASVAKRFAMGAVEPWAGITQLASRPVGAAGRMAGSDYLSRSPGAADAAAADLGAAQRAGEPEGFDWARLAGNVAGTGPFAAARAPALLKAAFTAGRPLVQAAKIGAATGGGFAAMMPTEGGENFAGNKAAQVGVGTVGGALLGPAFSKAGEFVGRAVKAGVDVFKQGAQNMGATVVAELRANGIDPATASREFYKEVADQVAAAQQGTSGAVNAEALQIGGAADRLGVRGNMTQGQITRDPNQFGQEEFIRNSPGGGKLSQNVNEVQSKLQQHLGNMQRSTAPALETPQAGARVMQPLEDVNARGQQWVNKLYEGAKNDPGLGVFIQTKTVGQRVADTLKRDLKDKKFPSIMAYANELKSGKSPMTVREAEARIQDLNASFRGTTDPDEKRALSMVIREIDGAIDGAATKAGASFKQARSANKELRQLQERIPALGAVYEGTITPDQFLQKIVFGTSKDASKEAVTLLKGVLKKTDPGAWQQIKGQMVDSLRSAAGYTENAAASKFNPVAFDKALTSLRRSGKMGVLFDAGEVQMLNDIARVARAVGERPAGLSGTGLAGAARLAGMFGKLMERVASVPGVSQTVGAASTVVMPGFRWAQATNALSTPAYATAGQVAVPYRNALAGAAAAAPALTHADE